MDRIKLDLSLGRSFEDYCAMFNLRAQDLSKRVIGCGDGYSNFNARMKEFGYHVVSCDPIYRQTGEELQRSAAANTGEMVRQPSKRMEDNLFLYNTRANVTDEFLEDYEAGKQEGRYIPGALPNLPFNDEAFDLALCSYLLFTYPDLGLNFHYDSIREMARVAAEVRIYPLVDLNCRKPVFFESLIEKLREAGSRADIVRVDFGFYPDDQEMLIVY